MATEMLPERCVDHRVTETEILTRLKTLEEDVKELYMYLKDKVDNVTFKDLMDRNTKEIEELRKAVLRLSSADIKHGEALAGIQQILFGFKETQDLMRCDYSKLAECYTQTSVHIASITTMLAERARKQEETKDKVPVGPTIIEGPTTMWETLKALVSNKIVIYALVALVITIIIVLIGNQEEILKILLNRDAAVTPK